MSANELEICKYCSHLHNPASTCFPQNDDEFDAYDPDYSIVAADEIDTYVAENEAE